MTEIAQLANGGKVVVNGWLVRRPHQNTYSVVDATLKSYEVEDLVLAGKSPVKFFYTVRDVETFLTTGRVENISLKANKPARRYGQRQLAYFDSISPNRESGLDWER
jgi:hypothetical protein